MSWAEDKLKEINEAFKKLAKDMPEQHKGFRDLMLATLKEGKLDLKTKELIALALGIASGCEWCIVIHTKKALEAGATREEILEAAYVAVLMAGGPAVMHIIPLLKALDEFSPK